MVTARFRQESAGVTSAQVHASEPLSPTLCTDWVRRAPTRGLESIQDRSRETRWLALSCQSTQRPFDIACRRVKQNSRLCFMFLTCFGVEPLTNRRGGVATFECELSYQQMRKGMKEHKPWSCLRESGAQKVFGVRPGALNSRGTLPDLRILLPALK
jgi:hypothetical protein